MKNVMMLIGVLLLSASCVELNGSLQVQEAFKVKKKSGFLNLKTKTIELAPGSYQAELTAKSSKNLKLELRGGLIGKIDIPIKSDSSLQIPDDGPFHIEGKKIEQPFNISGVINTEVSHYGHTDTIERCQRERREKRCEKVCDKETNKCDVVCREVIITIDGWKDVSYHYKSVERDAKLEFSLENSSAVVAVLPVHGTEVEKIIDRESLCR